MVKKKINSQHKNEAEDGRPMKTKLPQSAIISTMVMANISYHENIWPKIIFHIQSTEIPHSGHFVQNVVSTERNCHRFGKDY